MSIDWDAIEQETGKKYKDWAKEGTYTVKLAGAEVREAGNKGHYVIELSFEETPTTKYPLATYWLSKDKANYRIKIAKEVLTVLSGSEEKAKKACEMAESKDDFIYATKAYEKALSTLASKGVEVEIEVFPSGRYTQKGTEVNDATLKAYPDYGKKKDDNPMAGAEEIDLSGSDGLGELPFSLEP